jgi:hypothetical protein
VRVPTECSAQTLAKSTTSSRPHNWRARPWLLGGGKPPYLLGW